MPDFALILEHASRSKSLALVTIVAGGLMFVTCIQAFGEWAPSKWKPSLATLALLAGSAGLVLLGVVILIRSRQP